MTERLVLGEAELPSEPEPAVTIGRTLTNTFAGIKPSSAPMFIVMQILGALTAVALGHLWNPNIPAEDLVMPHEATS